MSTTTFEIGDQVELKSPAHRRKCPGIGTIIKVNVKSILVEFGEQTWKCPVNNLTLVEKGKPFEKTEGHDIKLVMHEDRSHYLMCWIKIHDGKSWKEVRTDCFVTEAEERLIWNAHCKSQTKEKLVEFIKGIVSKYDMKTILDSQVKDKPFKHVVYDSLNKVK